MSAVKPLNKKSSENKAQRTKSADDSAQVSKKISKKSADKNSLQPAPYLQTKLSVSTPGDTHEQEADRVADEVVSRSAANNSSPSETVSPGSSQPEKTLGNPQSLQAKISRVAEESISKMESSSENSESTESTDAENENQVSAEVEQQIESLKGQGAQLPEDVRTEMESQFSHDFSSVCIHNDAAADALCKQLSARAFTVGSDIFFASGEYAPNTQEGKRLLAHELTHVVQQGRGVTRKIMRDATTPPPNVVPIPNSGAGTYEFTLSGKRYKYVSSGTPRELHIPEVNIPNFKDRHRTLHQPLPLIRQPGPRHTEQSTIWKNNFRSISSLTDAISNKFTEAHNAGSSVIENGTEFYFFRGSRSAQLMLFGNQADVTDKFLLPFWDRDQQPRSFEVDHRREDQLGGSDVLENYELLDAGANGSSGSTIRARVDEQINNAKNVLQSDYYTNIISNSSERILDSPRAIKENYILQFNLVLFRSGEVENSDKYWTVEQITQGHQLASFRPLNPRELERFSNPRAVVLYASPLGGRAVEIPTAPGANTEIFPRVIARGPITINSADPNKATLLTDSYAAGDNRASLKASYPNFVFHLSPVPGMARTIGPRAWAIDREATRRQPGLTSPRSADGTFTSLGLPGLSPVTIDTLDIDPNLGFVGRGKLLPSIPIFENADIDVVILGSDIRLQKTFELSEIQVPPPFDVNRASVTLFASTANGLGMQGGIGIGIDKIGQCDIDAELSTSAGLNISGRFNFDEGLFNGIDATVNASYRRQDIFNEEDHGHWSLGGQIVIPRGKISGIDTATVNLSYSDEEGFRAHGEATLSVPGVENGTIDITHNEEEGMVIAGLFNLRQGRGIRGGQISARVQEKPDGSGYAVTAHGEAQPDIPGINSNLIVDYNDGAFTAEVSADYSRGMLSGQIHAGVTNRTVNEDGTLAETASENNELVVFGDGELTIQIAPWLQGTAGVRFAPNGEITVIGEIGLPGDLEIFARQEINRSIFNIAVQAPIFPGIVAEIGGGLSATAGIGPGVIDQLVLRVEYNPAHEEDTHITGDAHLNIPANAGLRLNVRAGIGLGITGASATGGLDIGGTLGIEGAAEAGVHVDWTPTTGLDITAELAVHAQPSFTFDIGGYVSVRALGFEVYDNRWQFASYTFGSDYRFGIRLPIHYHEGEPFEISTDDIVFEVPNIDTDQLLSGLIDRIA